MNLDKTYSLSDYVSTDGGALGSLDMLVKSTVGMHYMLAAAVILVLVIVVIMMMWKSKEGFNPTQTMSFQQRSDYGAEGLDPGRAQSVFAQTVQDASVGNLTVDPNAKAGAPGSLAYQVLNSPDFNCANRKPVGANAWDWMNTVAHENFANAPKTDNDFSKILSGQ